MNREAAAINYTLNGVEHNVSFSVDELVTVTIEERQKYALQRLLNKRPFVYYLSGNFLVISLKLRLHSPAVSKKIENLCGYTGVLTLTPDVCNTPEYSLLARMDPNVPSFYSMGRLAAGKEIDLVFYQVEAEQ